MSFARDVKEELAKNISNARHCRIAELASLVALCGIAEEDGVPQTMVIRSENAAVADKCILLIRKLFSVELSVDVQMTGPKKLYVITVSGELFLKVQGAIESRLVTQQTCCKRAYIRGSFLAAGSISNPEKMYHFEIVSGSKEQAERIRDIINFFEVDAKVIMRKKHYVVYIKEGSQIVELLNIMEAHVALMNLENIRIWKEMRNSVNRRVNCEAANISKTVAAASKQTEDILYIRDNIGLDKLAEGLEETARLRITYPEASLQELGSMLHPPIGKSGVNHRLKKLSQIAENLKG